MKRYGRQPRPSPLVSLLPLHHQSATSICNGVSSRPAMSSSRSPRGRYNVHAISLQPSSPLKWLPGGFDIPTQTPQNASSHINYSFLFSFRFLSHKEIVSVHIRENYACRAFIFEVVTQFHDINE